MATYSITPSAVQPTGPTLSATAGVAIDAGELIYLDANDGNKAKLAVNSSAAAANVVGMAVNTAAQGQPVSYSTSGLIAVGAEKFDGQGMLLVLSDTAGAAMDAADAADGEFLTVIGYSTSESQIQLAIRPTAVSLVVPTP